jgi:hypothetical protein
MAGDFPAAPIATARTRHGFGERGLACVEGFSGRGSSVNRAVCVVLRFHG